MIKQFDLNLENYSLQKFKNSLQKRDMIPSRVILKDDIEDRFNTLHLNGIRSVKALIDILKTKQKIIDFSDKTDLSVDYLTILKREASSYRPKPINLKKFPGVCSKAIEALEKIGIKNTKQFYNKVSLAKEANQLSEISGIPKSKLNELSSLSDLSRLYGVGPAFARIVYNAGIDSVEDFAKCTAKELIEIYENETQKKADFSEKDINFSLDLAKELTQLKTA